MPFDAEPSTETTTRACVMRLRDFLAQLPASKFDMTCVRRTPTSDVSTLQEFKECGTAACILGWATTLFPCSNYDFQSEITDFLGLSKKQGENLFMPSGWGGYRHYTLQQAVAVLDHYLATGDIDWDAVP